MDMQPIPILAYHSVAELTNERYNTWCVSPRRFDEQMSVLAERNFAVLTTGRLVEHLKNGTPLPDRAVVLTFDDGLKDFAIGAVPILERYGFPATLYVVAGLIGRTSLWLSPLGEGERPMLDAAEIAMLPRSGIEIGGHSMTHPELDTLDAETAYREIHGSRCVLEDVIGAPVRSFAYPHGYASRVTRRLAEKAGYDSAVRVRHALSQEGETRFGLSRLVITEDLDRERFLSLIEGRGVPVAPPQDRVASTAWRLVRKARHRLSPGPAGLAGPSSKSGGMHA